MDDPIVPNELHYIPRQFARMFSPRFVRCIIMLIGGGVDQNVVVS